MISVPTISSENIRNPEERARCQETPAWCHSPCKLAQQAFTAAQRFTLFFPEVHALLPRALLRSKLFLFLGRNRDIGKNYSCVSLPLSMKFPPTPCRDIPRVTTFCSADSGPPVLFVGHAHPHQHTPPFLLLFSEAWLLKRAFALSLS